MPLAELMAKKVREHPFFLEENWILVPVPLHRRRLAERGFNQAELFCRHLARLLGFSETPALRRVSQRPPQATLGKEDRKVNIKNIFRKLIAKLRIVQNVNVLTFAQDENSHSILKKNIKPGDFIVMINAGIKQDRDHIIVITKTNCEYNTPDSTNNLSIKKISYVHSFAWNKDGKYNHGVREGEIEIINENAGLLDQLWTEQCKTNQENETYIRATQAKTLEIRRLNALDEKN